MKIIWLVYRKEIRDLFRDKRVRRSAFIGPLIGIGFIVGLLSFITSMLKHQEGEKIGIIRSHNPLSTELRKQKFDVVDVASVADARKVIESGKVRLVLNFLHRAPRVRPRSMPTKTRRSKGRRSRSARSSMSLATRTRRI